ncbi:MAG: hypothetical protein AB4050_19610 [Synechococcus sp.]
MTRSQPIEQLEKGVPTVIGVRYKKGGHIVLVVGHDPNEEFFWAHDPFGVRQGASNAYDNTKSGAYDKYSYKLMSKIWNFGPDKTGWGRGVTSYPGIVA